MERREPQDHDAFLARKVAIPRDERHRGLGRPNAEVEAAFSARRAALLDADGRSCGLRPPRAGA